MTATPADALLERRVAAVDDARLTAMAAYVRLLADWEPTPAAAPTLLAKAEDTLPWSVATPGDHATVMTVPGDHFSMMDGDASTTAHAVREWLATSAADRLSSPA